MHRRVRYHQISTNMVLHANHLIDYSIVSATMFLLMTKLKMLKSEEQKII